MAKSCGPPKYGESKTQKKTHQMLQRLIFEHLKKKLVSCSVVIKYPK
jgi:hypothetical protein